MTNNLKKLKTYFVKPHKEFTQQNKIIYLVQNILHVDSYICCADKGNIIFLVPLMSKNMKYFINFNFNYFYITTEKSFNFLKK